MESCYIPNNPQYGLSLEYAAYSGAPSFSGTITGFTPGCNTIADGILCCRGELQECSCDPIRRLKDLNGHCHSRCDSEDCNEGLSLEERIALQNCDSRYVECERLESCELVGCHANVDDSLTGCDSHLVKCDDPVRSYGDHLAGTIDCLSDCDERLIETNDHLQLRQDEEDLAACGERISPEHSDDCGEKDLIGPNRILANSKDFRVGCVDYFEDNKTCTRNSVNKSHYINVLERLQDNEESFGNEDNHLNNTNEDFEDRERVSRECDNQLLDDEQLDEERLEFDEYRELEESGGAGTGCWISDEMASCSFSLPPLDLDPLPSLFPFSPCSGNYKGELKEKQPSEVADVLLSLKHAVVHPGAEVGSQYSQPELAIHPQVVMGGAGCYEPCSSGVFPTMSVNVSMNMTMHGYPPEQMCPQMPWNQNPASPLNVVYSQNQGVIGQSAYPGGTTYSFTADFRAPTQADPLITATSSFKPIQITSNQKCSQASNYNLFSQKSVQANFAASNHNQNYNQIKTRSTTRENILNGQAGAATYQLIGQPPNNSSPHDFGYTHAMNTASTLSSGKVQIGSLSGCSESEDEQKPNLCRICGKTYARPSTLKTHLRTHSGERPYRCSDCNKSFSQAANLTAHVRTHTGQKPFSCQICHRRFSQSSSVTTHMRTHSGERPYRCRACKKAFSDSSTLTKHLRIHSGEKPYQCKLCFLRFSQSGNLNRHMRVHGSNVSLLG